MYTATIYHNSVMNDLILFILGW